MIRVYLSRLLGERKLKVAELSRKTGIDKHSLADLYYEKISGIRFDTLEKICEALSCKVQDLLEYVPGEPNSDKQATNEHLTK